MLSNNVISHDNSGVSAGTYGATTQQTPSHGGTFSVSYVTVDDKGHVTSASTASVKLPNDNNTYPTTVTYTQAAGAQTTINIPLNNNTTVHGLVPNYVGATASVAGKPGLVPSATTAQRAMFLKADGTWATPSTGTDTQVTHTGTTSPIYLLGTINTADGTSTVNLSPLFEALKPRELSVFTIVSFEISIPVYLSINALSKSRVTCG